jgi:spermidine synthase
VRLDRLDHIGRWHELGRASITPTCELVLRQRGHEFEIRVDGRELMSTRAHGSEEELARLACAELSSVRSPRVLIGGLGMGYTLRATLDLLPTDATILVAELVPAVIDWNDAYLGTLTDHPMRDERCTTVSTDVADLLSRSKSFFDAILLDVDNGPMDLSRDDNAVLYSVSGLSLARAALRPGGTLAIWSANASADFEARLREAGFDSSSIALPARGHASDPRHTVFLGRA